MAEVRARRSAVKPLPNKAAPQSVRSGFSLQPAVAAAVIVLATLIAYASSLNAGFVFDDTPSIVDNLSIRSLRPLQPVLFPPQGGLAGSGRPLVNLSYALNYRFAAATRRADRPPGPPGAGGFGSMAEPKVIDLNQQPPAGIVDDLAADSKTRSLKLDRDAAHSGSLPAALPGPPVSATGFHAVNLLIHLLAALTLFGTVRQTLRRIQQANGSWLALAIALLWALHPLQTEAVTYLSQRSESLVSLFFLLTLYCFIRGWRILSVAACAAGMASKEVMAAAPLIVLLYDRTFLSGSFRSAWSRGRGFYLSLASTWLLLAALVISAQGRGGTAGFATGLSPWDYLLTQCVAIPHYLRLLLWPAPLVVDYGRTLGGSPAAVAWGILLLLALLAATCCALVRRPILGFLGACFFAILAPSSSFVPVATETIAEHRMYLPSAAVIGLIVLGAYRLLAVRAGGRASSARRRGGPATAGTMLGTAAVAAALAAATLTRNQVYRNNVTLFTDAVRKLPGNAVAQNNLGVALAQRGALAEAIAHYERAVALRPEYAEAQNDLGGALSDSGRPTDAIPHLEAALRARPGYAEADNNLGTALVYCHRAAEAVPIFAAALRSKPDYPEAENNLAFALNQLGRSAEALAHAQAAIRLRPDYAEAHNNLGNAFALSGNRSEAIQEYREALRFRPDLAAARMNLTALLHE